MKLPETFRNRACRMLVRQPTRSLADEWFLSDGQNAMRALFACNNLCAAAPLAILAQAISCSRRFRRGSSVQCGFVQSFLKFLLFRFCIRSMGRKRWSLLPIRGEASGTQGRFFF